MRYAAGAIGLMLLSISMCGCTAARMAAPQYSPPAETSAPAEVSEKRYGAAEEDGLGKDAEQPDTAAPEDPSVRLNVRYLKLTPATSAALVCETTGEQSEPVVWSTNNEAAVTVDQDGHISAAGTGYARITAAQEEYKDSVPVWVTDAVPDAPSVDVPPCRFSMGEDHILRNPESGQDSVNRAVIDITGDLMALSAQQNAARTGGTYNYNSSFDLVKPVFGQADFVVGNLETCISYSNPYTAQEKHVQGNPNCNAQSAFLDAVRYAGYDAVVTANNHCADAGAAGVYETIEMLDAHGIAHTGTFTEEQEPRFLIADVNGIRMGILSYTELINTKTGSLGIPEDEQALVLNRYSQEKVQRDVAAARESGAEYIIAYNHWGTENTHAYTQQQMEHAQQMADAGVDFIAGSHSHCLQPPVTLTAADGRSVYCVFSLGNFVSSMAKSINNDTVIVRLTLEKDGSGAVSHSAGYIPCRVFPEFRSGHHVIVPVPESLNGGCSNSVLEDARARITGIFGTDVLAEISNPQAELQGVAEEQSAPDVPA